MDSTLKKIELSEHVRFCVPVEWPEISNMSGMAQLRTPDGGSLTVQLREFRKPPKPGAGMGPTSEQLLGMQVQEFGAQVKTLSLGRTFASHAIKIGAPGQEQNCRAWHVVNQAAAWHHETILFTYEPLHGGMADARVIAVLNMEVPRCEFDRSLSVTR